MGRPGAPPRYDDRGRTDYSTLAHPASAPTEALHRTSDDVTGGDPRRDARRVGSVLQLESGMATFARREVAARPHRLRPDLEVVPSDVREHGCRHRQRARAAIGTLGAMDRHRVPATVPRQA